MGASCNRCGIGRPRSSAAVGPHRTASARETSSMARHRVRSVSGQVLGMRRPRLGWLKRWDRHSSRVRGPKPWDVTTNGSSWGCGSHGTSECWLDLGRDRSFRPPAVDHRQCSQRLCTTSAGCLVTCGVSAAPWVQGVDATPELMGCCDVGFSGVSADGSAAFLGGHAVGPVDRGCGCGCGRV